MVKYLFQDSPRLALDDARDRFDVRIGACFCAWTEAFTVALKRTGFSEISAAETTEEIIVGIQESMVLARSRQDLQEFARTLKRLRHRITAGA